MQFAELVLMLNCLLVSCFFFVFCNTYSVLFRMFDVVVVVLFFTKAKLIYKIILLIPTRATAIAVLVLHTSVCCLAVNLNF